MAFTQSDLDKINLAIVNRTAAKVRFEGRETEFSTISDLERIRTIIQADLAAQSGTRRRSSLASFTRQS